MRLGYGEGRSVKEVMHACFELIRYTLEKFDWLRDLTNGLTLAHRPNCTYHGRHRQWKPVRVSFLSSDGAWSDICKWQRMGKSYTVGLSFTLHEVIKAKLTVLLQLQ
jgi:hypothetical protein